MSPSRTGRDESRISTIRIWIATIVVIIVVIATWKFIDWRMQPPPPVGNPNATATP